MKVALVYDRVNKWGGAERVLLALHDLFPKAPLYTSVYDSKRAEWAKDFTIKTSFLQYFPFATSAHEYYALLMPLAFESFSFDEYDLVISVTSEAAKGVITKPHTKHICYCLTPTRYLWSGYNDYFKNHLLRFTSTPVVSYLRFWDKIASKRPDAYIAISKEVRARIKKYYDRESEVVYPPVDLSNSKSQIINSKQSLNTKYQIPKTGFFLVVSRLVPYKRIDIAIEACNVLGLPLVIVGVGSEENHLRNIAGKTVTILGNLTDSEVVEYYKACRAVIFPGNEDFGLVMAEAQRFGKPVIAYKAGGALEIVGHETGDFFYPQTAEGLIKILKTFDEKKFSASLCIANAKKFSLGFFKKNFMTKIESLL